MMLGCLLALLPGWWAGCARADELVQIAPHWTAASLGRSDHTPPLLGFLARPDGAGRFPAVVVLRWCSGFGDHDTRTATRLKAWGYVALALDSLGDANMCQSFGGAAAEAADAYAALDWLRRQDFVAPERVAVMGFSMGGSAVLEVLEQGLFQQLHPAQFRAGIAYYPLCRGSSGIMVAPALVLIGADDDWASAAECGKMAAHDSGTGITRHAGGAPVDLVVYPGATHAFDAPGRPHRYLGHELIYDPDATRQASSRVSAFLRQTIGDQPDPR